MGRRAFPFVYLTAVCAVLPLAAPEVWSGFRLANADPVLAAIASTEQPLSVRSPAGEWAMLLALVWFALAYWRRDVRPWEIAAVVLGGAVALVRAGNAWLDALLLIVPLARQVSLLNPRPWMLAAAAAVGLAVAGVTLYITRPPALPQAAVEAAAAAATRRDGTVFADWRWAPQLQRQLGNETVLASHGLGSESPDFWVNYVRVVEDYEQWPGELQAMNVNLLVLDSHDASVPDQVRASPDWRVLYDTGEAFVAERVSS
jgi:hypothetical protein